MTRDVAAADDLVQLSTEGNYHTIPTSCLSYSTVANVGKRLQVTEPETFSSSGCVQSWIGAAELMGIDNDEINNLRENKAHLHCFKAVFDIWKKKSGSSVGALISFLQELERYDILEDSNIIKLIKKDVDHYQESQLSESQESIPSEQGASCSPSQQNGLMSSRSPANPEQLPFYRVNETKQMTVDDVKTGAETKYDAYVSYVEEDIKFVKQLIQHMECEPHKLKLCVDARDLLVGQSRLTVTANLIQNRCRKVIVVVSKEFLKSEISIFQVRFAHALSPASVTKRLVPIMIDPDVEMGRYLQEITFLTTLPYKRSATGEWFWERLISSVKSHPVAQEEETENIRNLKEVEIETALLPSRSAIEVHSSEGSSSESEVDEGFNSEPISRLSSRTSCPSLLSSSASQGAARSISSPGSSGVSASRNVQSSKGVSSSQTSPPESNIECSASTGRLDSLASSSSGTVDSLDSVGRSNKSSLSSFFRKIKPKKKKKGKQYVVKEKQEAAEG